MNKKTLSTIGLSIIFALSLTGCSVGDAPVKEGNKTTVTKEEESNNSKSNLISIKEAGVPSNFTPVIAKGWEQYKYAEAGFIALAPTSPQDTASVTMLDDDSKITQFQILGNDVEFSIMLIETPLAPKDEVEEIGRALESQKNMFSNIEDFKEVESEGTIEVSGLKAYRYSGTSEMNGNTYYLDSAAVYRGSNMYVISSASRDKEDFSKFAQGFEMIDAEPIVETETLKQ